MRHTEAPRTPRLAFAVGVAVLSMALLSAQEVAFEVASVKVAAKDDANPSGRLAIQPGQVTVLAAPLPTFVPTGFGVPVQLSDAKFDFSRISRDLVEHTYFDIQAKGNPAGDQSAMMQTLLRDRFGLKWHKEVRTAPLYTLTVKQPGKLGPWLKATTVNCREWLLKAASAAVPAECQSTRRSIGRDGNVPQRGAGTNVDLVVALQGFSNLPLIDATGLKGNYLWDIAMPWAPGPWSSRELQHAVAFRKALEEQLGLTLARSMGPWKRSSSTTSGCRPRTEEKSSPDLLISARKCGSVDV